MSVLNLEAKLERYDSSTPWGFRMQGGKDFNSPLIIQNVNPGSLAAKCGLEVGDLILRIGNASTEYLLHKEAQSSILESGNRLDLLLQRKGNDSIRQPQNDSSNIWKSQQQPVSPQSYSSNQNFNSQPRPFGSQATARPNYESNLSQQTAGLSLSSEPAGPVGYNNSAERYTERQDAPNPAQHQSRSFRKLASLIDEDGGNENPAHPLTATPIGPGSKPGTVKAIVSQRYNNPIGLYSNENVTTQFQGQSKFLMENDDAASKQNLTPACESTFDEHGKKKYVPSETFRLVQAEVSHSQKVEEVAPVHSKSFKMIQQQLDSGEPEPVPASVHKPKAVPSYQPRPVQVAKAAPAKPWAPPPAQPQVPRSAAPPVPTGIGAIRGKRGDAAMNPAILPAAGHVPVCVGCHLPIRGPFVTALGKCWCPDHFVCANPRCGIKLQDTGFVEEGGFLYCEQDYAVNFAPQCDRCRQPVVGECVNAMQKSFHPSCFLCTQCQRPISGTKFHVEDGNFYCEADWMAMFQTMCSGCNFPIEPGDKWVEAVGKNFHSECFNCATCQINLEGQQFCAKGGRPYCKKHAN